MPPQRSETQALSGFGVAMGTLSRLKVHFSLPGPKVVSTWSVWAVTRGRATEESSSASEGLGILDGLN